MNDQPHVIILGGPNGAGKSTAAPAVLKDLAHIEKFVNADIIAQGLSAYSPESEALQAGKLMLTRLHELAEQRETFAFETTLASRTFAVMMRNLLKQGYAFDLMFFWLPSAEMAITRVASRVSQGGHHVPPDVVKRRYYRGLHNFFRLYKPLATTWRIYDNTDKLPALIARGGSAEALAVSQPEVWRRLQQEFDHD